MDEREKQIECMAEILENTQIAILFGYVEIGETKLRDRDARRMAEALYDAGCRMESEAEWVTEGDELKNTYCSACGHWVETPYGKTRCCPECGKRMKEKE